MKPLVHDSFVMEKMEGKGGWTFVRLPEFNIERQKPFRWAKVKGSIDDFPFEKYHLMPMGDGHLFLPVRAEIRKKIGKQAGDPVVVIIYPDTDPLLIPEEMLLCLQDEPRAMHFFNSLSESEKKYYVQWIFSAKKSETKANRMARCLDRLVRGKKMYDVEPRE